MKMEKVNRLKELERLLEKLRKEDDDNNSDMDLVLKCLEEFLLEPRKGGGSEKLMEFEVRHDTQTNSQIFNITWKKYRELWKK